MTEGIKYAGSKLRLVPHILHLAATVRPGVVFDGFSGTTRVAQAFARSGCRVIANDVAVWSRVFASAYLLDTFGVAHYAPLIAHLNALPGKRGWFTENYGGDPAVADSTAADGFKKPWQVPVTMKLDAIREEIDRLTLSAVERDVLLTSLILALDRVDSTLGHYASYLHTWSARSYHPLELRVPALLAPVPDAPRHKVLQGDIFDVLPGVEADLAYYDPPYGSNNDRMPPSRVRYAAYYHLWTTVCLNDRPVLFGKARRRADSSDPDAASVFEDFRRAPSGRFAAVEAIERLIGETRAPYLILSYSSGGRATAAELGEVLSGAGTVLRVEKIDYRRNVMAAMRWTNEWVRATEEPHCEFLFLLRKR